MLIGRLGARRVWVYTAHCKSVGGSIGGCGRHLARPRFAAVRCANWVEASAFLSVAALSAERRTSSNDDGASGLRVSTANRLKRRWWRRRESNLPPASGEAKDEADLHPIVSPVELADSTYSSIVGSSSTVTGPNDGSEFRMRAHVFQRRIAASSPFGASLAASSKSSMAWRKSS